MWGLFTKSQKKIELGAIPVGHVQNGPKVLFQCPKGSLSTHFTDFVGEAVFGGNPQANVGSRERVLYDEGRPDYYCKNKWVTDNGQGVHF